VEQVCLLFSLFYRTASYLPSPLYYGEIFPVPAVITVVTAELPLSPLPCRLGGVAQWLGRQSVAGGLSLIYA